MTDILKRTASLLIATFMLFTVLHFPIIAEDGDDESPEFTVEQVTQLLEQIDSLQEMQDKRKTEFAATKRAITSANFASNIFDEEALEEHELLAAAYEAYVADMFAKRAEAKAAYDSLTPEQQAEIPAELSGKLDPYDQLDTVFNQRAYNILEPESENSPYIYQLIGAYECSNHGCGEIPATMALINVTDESIRNENGQWVPDKLYEYGECNYDIVYCSDAHPSPSTTNLYKRINLEDSTYYSKAAAKKLRAIVINSYPYVSIDEMKVFLKANGFDSDKADKLDRSEIIAGVQMAIWYFANTNNSDHEDLVGYQYTFNNYKNPWMPNRIHQFQNECWTWWDAAGNGQFSAWRPYKTYLNDIADRINSLVDFLVSLPGQEPESDQVIISDLQITRRQLVPGTDDTYTVGLKVILNNGRKASVDSVELIAETFQDGEAPARVATVDLAEFTEYEFEVTAKDGDTIEITAKGTQHLGKGVYCYETAAGARADQALISVTEGETRVRAKASIKFKREGDIGLRISKVARGEEHEYPISDIDFNVYAVPDTIEPEGEVPTQEEIDKIAVPENLAGTLNTDNSGYAFVDLPYGTYMLVELPSEKVIAPSDPVYFVLPNVKTEGDIVIVSDIVEIVVENTREDFETAAVELDAYKQFDDWGKADSFRFRLDPVTEGAPMPLSNIAVATAVKPLAVFEKITYDANCFDTGDPDSNVRTYQYTITEINDHVPGVTYDPTAYPVTVTVTKNIRIDTEQNIRVIEITAVVDYDGADDLVISNTFTATHAHFEATKGFNDWGKADSFTFVLKAVSEGAPMPDTASLTVTEADPTAVFAELEFDTVGVYEYTITEVDDHVPGVMYDTTPHIVTVTVTADVETNALSAAVDYEGSDALVITNTFSATSAHFEATKQFDDWGKADSFTFVLAAVTDGAPMPDTASLTVTEADPTAVFADLEYDTVGVYEYTITEVNDHVPGVTYDTTAHIVTVTVTADPDTNALSAVVDYDGADALVITNTFTATHAHFEATKQFDDWDKADSFTFVLAAVTDGAPMPDAASLTVTEAVPTAVFAELEFVKVGVYEYTITEVNDHVPGVTYDTAAHKVTVTVTADQDTNELSAVVDYDGADALVITNTFTSTHAHFEATKQFADWGKANSFTFVLAAITDGAPMPAAASLTVTEADPTAVFAELEFDTVGVYKYTITEVDDHVPGVTYDTTPHTVTVTVTSDPDTNALSAVVDYDDAATLVITNTFTATHAHFEATKQFTDWGKADSFTFVLAAVTDGAPMPAAVSLTVTEADPAAVFAELEFDTVGVYEYTITEVNDHVPGVTYDTAPHKVTVTVTADPDTNELSAVVEYDGADALVITNTFTATHAHFEATKQFEDWGKADSFTFVLASITDGAPMPAVTSLTVTEKVPTAVFAELEFDTVGVYEYTITEVNDHVPGVTYDTAAHKVTVTVTADPDTNELSAVVEYDGADALVITNTFTATHAHFEATKQFDDWGKADSFTFVLASITDGAPMPAVTSLTVTEKVPTAVFAELEFDTVGVYEYTITEVNDHVPGVTYDTAAHKVTVTVTADPDTNELSAVVDYDGADALVITNTFTATHAHFEATKQFDDWGKADSFTFVLAAVTDGAPMPAVTELTVTENDPTAVFAELEFDTVGVYKYEISEVDDHIPGVTYDTTPHIVTVTVAADPDTNALSAVVDYGGKDTLVITNTFTATYAHFEATKQFADWGKADSFTFVLAAITEGAPMPLVSELTVSETAPTAVFADLEYDTVGVYEYTITEVDDHVPGVTYDTTAHKVTVTVTADPDTNEFSAVVDYDGADALVITNTFTATHAHFEATKQFADWGKADSFTFVLAAVTEGAPMPALTELTVTENDPTAVFAELEFDTVGVYEYTITEINDGVPGVTYDTTAHKVTVTVTADPDTNELSAVVDYDGADTLVITNTFTAAHAHFEVIKQFDDWGKADSFTFVLAALTDGAPMPAVTELTVTENDPTAVFAELEFDTVGVYNYTITEVNDGVPGVTYDTAAHVITVTVTADAQTNALSAVVDYGGKDSLVITNTFTAIYAHFEATKQFSDWGKADSFKFVLAAVTEGAPMPAVTELTVTENAPTAIFAEVEFDTVGVYEYTITEVDDGVPGVTYDTAAHKVTVTVTADPDTNALSVVVDYDGSDTLVIINSYATTPCRAAPEVTKELTGRAWEDNDEFIFDIAAVTENAPLPKATSASATKANPTAVFGSIEFTEPGVYVYTITERAGNIVYMTYDTTPHTVTITVTDIDSKLVAEIDYDGKTALTVVNSLLPPPPPTGDERAFGSTAAILLITVAGAVLFTIRRRRYSEV